MAVDTDYELRRAHEMEQALLGGLLRDFGVAWPQIKDAISATDFVDSQHQLIFSAIAAVAEEGGGVDAFLVGDQLGDKLEEAGGREYLATLYEESTSGASAAIYAKKLRELAGHGKVIDFADAFAAKARNLSTDDALSFAHEQTERLRRERAAEAPAKPKPERRPMRWPELGGDQPPPRAWRISHWLAAGPTLLAGSVGVGKTLIAQTIATALALGANFIDNIPEPTTVLMWACEDDHDELWRRQIAICSYFGVTLSALEGKLIIEPRQGRENTLFSLAYGAPTWTSLRDELESQVRDYGARVVFLDNIGQLYGGKESERHQVTVFLNGLMGLAPDISIILMGHPSKSVDSEFSGSTAWENGVRMRWYMGYRLPDQKGDELDEDDPNVRFLAKRKTNYSEKDFRKLEFRDGLFVPERQQGMSFAARWGGADRAAGAEARVLDALSKFSAQHIRVTDGKTSPDYLPKKMREMKLTHDFSPKELATALGQLRLNGKIVEGEVAKYGNRTAKIGLMVAP